MENIIDKRQEVFSTEDMIQFHFSKLDMSVIQAQ